MTNLQNSLEKHYNAFLPLAIILVTLCLATVVIGYQLVEFKGWIFSAVALIIPIRYLLCDIVAEVYGFKIAKKLIALMILAGLFFSLLLCILIKLPAPAYWKHSEAYDFVLGGTLRIMCSASLGVIVGSFLNVYLVSRWRILAKGQFFWLRSLASSGIGEITQYLIGLALMFHGFLEWDKLFHLIINDYLVQVSVLLFLSPIAHVCMLLLRNYEQIEPDDHALKVDSSGSARS